MAAKRTATTELTDRNWDQEDEPEEAGTWNPASRDQMAKRRVRKAIRRGNAGSSEGGSGAFSTFSGLTSKPASAVFSLTSGAPKPLTVSNGNKTTPSVPFSGFGTATPTPGVSDPSPAGGPTSPKYSPQYCSQLQNLNRSLLQWLQKHVDSNPICDLTPSFRDYEKHLRDIEARFPPATPTDTVTLATDKTSSQSGNGQLSFKFSSSPQNKTDTSAVTTTDSSAAGGVTIGQSSTPAGVTLGQSSSPAGITIGQSSSFLTGTSTAPSPFSFSASSGGAKFGGSGATLDSGFKFNTTTSSSSSGTAGSGFKFSFASKPSAPTTESSDTKEEEEYEPPKPEVKEVKEDGAFYTVRCKLFYQKDGAYKDKGVGNLHLKKAGDDKTQLVVRADTSLGNILLNILLFPSMPVSRQGKNNVALVCVPNPPLDEKSEPKPTPMLIRVKTGEAADELCKQLNDNKGTA